MDICEDPLCSVCTRSSKQTIHNRNTSMSLINQTSNLQVRQNLDDQLIAQQESLRCASCLEGPTGAPPLFNFGLCLSQFASAIGICSVTSGSRTTLWAPNGSIIIDRTRLSNALNTINMQVPGGSIQGYLTSIINNIGLTVGTDVGYIFAITVGVILAQSFIFYLIICIILMTHNVMTLAGGFVMIIIGLMILAVVVAIIFIEASKYGNQIVTSFRGVGSEVFSTIGCALGSGVCCYSGVSCCCPGTLQPICANQPYPPGSNPPCGRPCGVPPPCGLTPI